MWMLVGQGLVGTKELFAFRWQDLGWSSSPNRVMRHRAHYIQTLVVGDELAINTVRCAAVRQG